RLSAELGHDSVVSDAAAGVNDAYENYYTNTTVGLSRRTADSLLDALAGDHAEAGRAAQRGAGVHARPQCTAPADRARYWRAVWDHNSRRHSWRRPAAHRRLRSPDARRCAQASQSVRSNGRATALGYRRDQPARSGSADDREQDRWLAG